MGKDKLGFVKGHMGGNQILLTLKEEFPSEDFLGTSIPLLKFPHIRGDQLAILSNHPDGKVDIKVKIIDRSYKDYLDMCGGVTQVLGKALVETYLGAKLELELDESPAEIILETDIGLVSLEVYHQGGHVEKVLTEMKPFVRRCYEKGVKKIQLDKLQATKAGDFLVVEGDKIEQAFPNVSLDEIGDRALDALIQLQRDFDEKNFMEKKNAEFAVYDLSSEVHDGRLIFPHKVSSEHIEPACGTGTVAIGLAMAENGQLPETDRVEFFFDSGGSPRAIGGPDSTTLQLELGDEKVENAYFSHSLVEILATGEAWI